jgi:hypothetical protein
MRKCLNDGVLIVVLLAISCVMPATWAVDQPYAHPTIAIPYARAKPVIDGVVDDAEWQEAFSQRALQTTSRQISARQSRYWMMWDEENIYIAMRDPLRVGERPLQVHRGRRTGKDLDIIYDDCYEIWVSVGATDPLTGQPNCFTQFLGNFGGARYDAIHQPAVGNSRTSSYDTNWEPKSRLTAKNEWEMELVIPRASLGTTKGPFHDGMHFRTLIARNYKRPWEQNSFEGTSSFSVIDTHSEFVMSKTAPALHLLGVGDAATGRIGMHLAAFGQADGKIAWRYASDAVTKEGTATVRKGALADVVNLPDLDVPGPGKVRITVTEAGGATAGPAGLLARAQGGDQGPRRRAGPRHHLQSGTRLCPHLRRLHQLRRAEHHRADRRHRQGCRRQDCEAGAGRDRCRRLRQGSHQVRAAAAREIHGRLRLPGRRRKDGRRQGKLVRQGGPGRQVRLVEDKPGQHREGDFAVDAGDARGPHARRLGATD